MVYRTLPDPLLLPVAMSPHHSSLRLSSSLGARREREAPSGLRMKDCLAKNPVRGLWG